MNERGIEQVAYMQNEKNDKQLYCEQGMYVCDSDGKTKTNKRTYTYRILFALCVYQIRQSDYENSNSFRTSVQ